MSSLKNINQVWGQRLQQLRCQRSISRQEVASFMNLSVQQIRKYETGESALTLYRLQQLADLMEYPLSLLLSTLTNSEQESYLSSEEKQLIHLFRKFSPNARNALLYLIQKSIQFN